MTDAALAAELRRFRAAYFGPTEPARYERRPGFTPPPPVGGFAALLDTAADRLEELTQ